MQRYERISIVDAARRGGVYINARTLGRSEVEARCPFCGDKPGRYHLRLNTSRDVFKCFLCGTSGNSVTLYTRLRGISNKESAEELLGGSNVYRLPIPQKTREAIQRPLSERHAVYSALSELLTLSDAHRENLRARGLSDERIERNGYRTLPEAPRSRLILAGMLSRFYGLGDVPGFYSRADGRSSLAGAPGLLIPYRDVSGMIQGLQIRLDTPGDRRYRWLASTNLRDGAVCGTHVHVTGDASSDTVYITEGALKGDAASFLDNDALFVCIAGVSAVAGLSDALRALGARRAVVALDMDRLGNSNVRDAIGRISGIVRDAHRHGGRGEIRRNICAEIARWDARYKGIDDYYLSGRGANAREPLTLEAA
jgi:hypothetical protein